jgi:hypothetical protein
LQDLFQQYAGVSTATLLKEQRQNGPAFSLQFLRWLSEEVERCDDDDRTRQLDALAGRIMSLRCGVVPVDEIPSTASATATGEGHERTEDAESALQQPLRGWPVELSWKPEHELEKRGRV